MTSSRATLLLLVIALPMLPSLATAYELRTHSAITVRAFDASQDLSAYLDAVGIAPGDKFDSTNISKPEKLDFYENDATPRGWMGEGAIREDDFSKTAIGFILRCPQPEGPDSEIGRPLNHFLDVQHSDQGLHVGLVTGLPSVDWGLGVQGRGPDGVGNAFTILDARAYQLASLLGTSRSDRDKSTADFFRALGQVVHLLQDAAQPQHTRNDPHAGCLFNIGGERSWYELYIDKRARGELFRARGETPPGLSLSGYGTAPFPAALDFGYKDFFTRSDSRGLGNFSSLNFLSAGTNLPSKCSGFPEPPCNEGQYFPVDRDFEIPVLGGGSVSGRVTLFTRPAVDQLTGETILGVPLSSRSLWDQHLEHQGGDPEFTLNTLNYDAMADLLIPRAVGYSAGLLDYVFRAKLDARVERVQEGDPPADTNRIRLTATNASRDPMVDGTLTIVYERINGQRLPVQLSSPAPVPDRPGVVEHVSADPSADLPVVEFVEPAEAVVRYVAVYQGTLGREVAGSPTGSIGAVAARTIEVGWVERTAALGSQRTLTNRDGEFTFPPAVDRLERRRFGDLNNWVVGTASLDDLNPTFPDQVVAFQIARPLDSTDVPLELDVATATDYVKLADSRLVNFPYGLDLGVQVTFSETLQTTHQLLILEFDTTDTGTTYTLVRRDPTVVSSASGWNTRLTLDQSKLIEVAGPTAGPYVWRVAEVGQDAQQRLLALVEVRLNSLGLVTNSATEQSLNEDCEDIPGLPVLATTGHLVDIGSIWAVIDVVAGRVLGVSSEPNVNIGLASTGGSWSLWVKKITHPDSGTTVRCQVPAESHAPDPDDNSPPFETVTLTPSVLIRTISGQYRPDLQKAAGTTLTPFSGTDSGDLIVASVFGDILYNLGKIRFETPFSGQSGYLTLLRQGMRMAPGDGSPAAFLLRFARPVGVSAEQEEGVLAKWVPEAPSRTGLAFEDELPTASAYEIKAATPKWALVSRDGGNGMLVVDLERKAIAREYSGQQAVDLNNDFVLLPSRSLYNVETTHFFLATPTLDETAEPPVLFGAPFVDPDPGAAYQVFGRR
jgi:hypothetical protein